MEDCIFCKIVNGDIPCTKVYEDDEILAFQDIQPIAPVHILVIPKEHISSIMEFTKENMSLTMSIHKAIQKVSKNLGLDQSGFRVINNYGEHGQQTVHHIHYHVIGGRQLQWPPG